jgi:hypothetical protein
MKNLYWFWFSEDTHVVDEFFKPSRNMVKRDLNFCVNKALSSVNTDIMNLRYCGYNKEGHIKAMFTHKEAMRVLKLSKL